jgi:hypothetical protein
MGGGAENLGLNIFLEPGHDADGPDQGGDTKGDAGDRDECIERDGSVPPFGTQVTEADEDFVGEGHRNLFLRPARMLKHGPSYVLASLKAST